VKIKDVRILPPIAIGRLGSSKNPLDAFDLEPPPPEHRADYRRIVPMPTFTVNDAGEVTQSTPAKITFKDADGKVRPVAPFLQVFAITDDADELVPLTVHLLEQAKLGVDGISWSVRAGNHKVFRRTRNKNDLIDAKIPDDNGNDANAPTSFNDHEEHKLDGRCENFKGGKTGKTLPLGTVRFIKPTKAFPEIRLRFTPAEGKVYGSSTKRIPAEGEQPVDDKVITEDLVRYDPTKGWYGFVEKAAPDRTNPPGIFAGIDLEGGGRQSWGYLDDECDGIVTFSLRIDEKTTLTTRAVIVAGPPAFAPDSLPVRVVSDEMEQILLGPEVGKLDVAEAMEQTRQIVRRSLDTIRLMNTAIANGGRNSVASRDDRGGQIMAPSLVDNRAVVELHEQILAALASGTPPWFSEALRRPEEVGDLTDTGRRKMPALMRNADGYHLALTTRMINTVVLAETQGAFQTPGALPPPKPPLTPGNLAAQLHHRGEGNPVSVLAKSAISNCFPGLEFDFRNFWRRAFEEIVLLENSNLVIGPAKTPLMGCRLLRVDIQKIDGKKIDVATIDPSKIDFSKVNLKKTDGRNVTVPVTGPDVTSGSLTFMEWSNALADVLQKQGQRILCVFTAKPSADQVLFDEAKVPMVAKILTVRKLFDDDSAAVADGAVEPGDLTQGLCAPWQNDYRECACFYWAASRPDYVNVEAWSDGLSRGDNWLAKERTGTYVVDDRIDSRLVSYDDLFQSWEEHLRFIIGGRDADVSP
jgi:hypothetical protein